MVLFTLKTTNKIISISSSLMGIHSTPLTIAQHARKSIFQLRSNLIIIYISYTGSLPYSRESGMGKLIMFKTQLLLLGKFEYTGGPIFKVVLEC